MEFRDRIGNVRSNSRLILQGTIAATLAYAFATYVVGHKQPFFAPIAAIAVVAVSVGDRLRRSIDLLIGNAIGILLADLLIARIGSGVWQLGLAVLVTLIAATFLGGGPTITMQSASATILISTIAAPTEASPLNTGRFLDALVGGGVGLAVCAVILPTNPLRVIRRSMVPVIGVISDVMDDLSAAIRSGELARTTDVLRRARGTHGFIAGMAADARASDEALRTAPVYWRSRDRVDAYGLAAVHLDNMLRNVRVAARNASATIEAGESIPAGLADALEELAAAARVLPSHLEADDPECSEVREGALDAVSRLGGSDAVDGVFGAAATAAVFMAALDLLMATGMPREHALREARARTAR